MKRSIFVVLVFLFLFCVSMSEESDYANMSPYDQGLYISTLPMPEALNIMDMYDQDPKVIFVDAINSCMAEWEGLSDVTLYLSYASMHMAMQERDLMKYLSIIGMESPNNPVTNLSSLSFHDLSSLMEHINQEMMRREEWQEVFVPAGTYQVGKQIPAGHWMIACTPRNYCYIDIGGALESNGKEIVYGSEGYYHIALTGTDSGISDRGYPAHVDLVLKDGMYISIEHAGAFFTPYTGNHGFTFK